MGEDEAEVEGRGWEEGNLCKTVRE